ncbi:MAG: VC0807 family protein [Candidatus Woesearchaeota archaeon]
MNALMSLLLNIVLPIIILQRFSHISPVLVLCIALLFPITYGCIRLYKNNTFDIIAILGIVSILLTGVIGVFALDNQYLAIKEAAIPGVLTLLIFISVILKFPLLEKITAKFVDTSSLKNNKQYKQKCQRLTWYLLIPFVFSTITNYFLTQAIVSAPSGTQEFNAQIATLTWVSVGVIAVPATIVMMFIFYSLISFIEKHTNKDFESLLKKQ